MSTMTFTPQLRIPATYMRGGTSKGVFFKLDDLPDFARGPGKARDALLVRVIGSPDPYGQVPVEGDFMTGAATAGISARRSGHSRSPTGWSIRRAFRATASVRCA